MRLIAGSLPAVCSRISHSESGHGIPGQDRPDREEILLREVSIHLAESRDQALHLVSGQGALSFRRWNRTNHVAAGASATAIRRLILVWRSPARTQGKSFQAG